MNNAPPLWGTSIHSLGVCPSSGPPPPALTDLPLSSLAGTDALGHDAPPTSVCSDAARVTEPSLSQLFPVSVSCRLTLSHQGKVSGPWVGRGVGGE